jgi:hypothetical protein
MCFNIVRQLALEFGLLRMVRQPSADTHVIWVARHKVTRPQTILKFRPPSSLDYRTRHGSQSLKICDFVLIFGKKVKTICSPSLLKSDDHYNKTTTTTTTHIPSIYCVSLTPPVLTIDCTEAEKSINQTETSSTRFLDKESGWLLGCSSTTCLHDFISIDSVSSWPGKVGARCLYNKVGYRWGCCVSWRLKADMMPQNG